MPLVIDRELAATIKVGRKLTRTIIAPAELVAPIPAGTVVGEVTVKDGQTVIGTRTLIVEQAIEAPSVAERIRSGIGRLV